jgi:hypothetical protein
MTRNPAVAAADTILGGLGQIAYVCRKKHYDGQEGDPRQYNASTLVDMGVEGGVALLADASNNLGKLTAKARELSADDRLRLEARLKAFEEGLENVKDPEIKERLLTSRRNVREILDGR